MQEAHFFVDTLGQNVTCKNYHHIRVHTFDEAHSTLDAFAACNGNKKSENKQ